MDPYSEYQTAKADYVNFAQQDFGGQLRDSIMKEVNDNKDLIAQVRAGEEGYYNAPSQARVTYENIFNPFQREALVDKATGLARQGWTVPQDILKQRMGLISDTVAGAEAGYEKQAGLKKDLVDMAWNEYQASRKGSGGGSYSQTKTMTEDTISNAATLLKDKLNTLSGPELDAWAKQYSNGKYGGENSRDVVYNLLLDEFGPDYATAVSKQVYGVDEKGGTFSGNRWWSGSGR